MSPAFFLRRIKQSISYFWHVCMPATSYSCLQSHTLPHIDLQDRGKGFYSSVFHTTAFVLCSDDKTPCSAPCSDVVSPYFFWRQRILSDMVCAPICEPSMLNLITMIAGLIIQGWRVALPAGPIISVAVPVLSSCNSTALSASCHHPKLARRPSAVQKFYCCQVLVFASSRNVFLKEVQWTVLENGWINDDRNKSWYKVISIKAPWERG